jgi:hypothetical protein
MAEGRRQKAEKIPRRKVVYKLQIIASHVCRLPFAVCRIYIVP